MSRRSVSSYRFTLKVSEKSPWFVARMLTMLVVVLGSTRGGARVISINLTGYELFEPL
jgi:hypothetical protein